MSDYGAAVPFVPDNFPPGSWALGGTRIYHIVSWEGKDSFIADWWETTDAAEIDPDSPTKKAELFPRPDADIVKIPARFIGSTAKSEKAEQDSADIKGFVEEIEEALKSTPRSVYEVASECPSLEELDDEQACKRAEGFLKILAKQKRAVEVDGQWMLAATPASDDTDGSPADSGMPAPKADLEKPSPSDAPAQSLPGVSLHSSIKPLIDMFGLPVDEQLCQDVFNPTWLMKDVDEEAGPSVDDCLGAAAAALCRLMKTGVRGSTTEDQKLHRAVMGVLVEIGNLTTEE